SQTVDDAECRPDGLHPTPGVAVPYCDVYDTDGREVMSTPRRIIGYFTSWRTGTNGQPAYLASDIPWQKLTHINYAFAHVDSGFEISVNESVPGNPATDLTWPGVPGADMDPSLPYEGHFNLLNRYQAQHPDVKTLVSVGGWAETGGFLDADGNRVPAGGFYRMTTNPNGSVNTAGIDTFVDSAVQFVRQYGFNGIDIDYEYATSNKDAGHPEDWAHANPLRGGLNASYHVLMRELREALDRAAAADGRYYLLTVAAPASGWLLRGTENSDILQYLDYVNIMSYDLHGAWNRFVGPNAALYDNGDDGELAAAGVYSASQYGGIGYLNTDWAYHYFRGGMPPGRINIGVPFYTRGWREVTGGSNGLWGSAPSTDCPIGLTQCGNGAVGIDNLWHDLEGGQEVGAGSNPLWHARNLADGRIGSYAGAYGLDPAGDPADALVGSYTAQYSAAHVAPWLWNSTKRVFLSTETEQSLGTKADYVVDNGIGGVMLWELAGDFGWDGQAGEWFMGDSLVSLLHDRFASAAPYRATKANVTLPAQTVDVGLELVGYPLGDNNYPISPKLRVTNRTGQTLPGGTAFEFDYPTSAPPSLGQQSGWSLTHLSSDHTGHNRGGLRGDFHRVRLTLPSWQSLAAGASAEVQLAYQLPIAGPSNVTVSFGGQTFRLAYDHPRGAVPPSTDPPTDPPSSPPPSEECAAAAWLPGQVYTSGIEVSHAGHQWRAKWWTQGEEPGTTGEWGVWTDLGVC
ncbi:MAG: chitinase C-terminal domain-containing protein, partial [Natronosporangium sp.]